MTPVTIRELQVETGLGRELVKAGIRSGQLPGHLVGTRYVIPRKAFDLYCELGTWPPVGRVEPTPIRPIELAKRRTA